jgi:3-methyladenine DNA glycosylase AlkD
MKGERYSVEAIDLVREIRQFCINNSDPAVADKYRRYFKEGYDPYGVASELIINKTKGIIASGLDFEIAIEAAGELISSGKYEEGHFAISMMKRMHKGFDLRAFDRIGGWFSVGINNWAHADGLALDVVAVFMTNKIVDLTCIEQWTKTEYKYQRRVAAVALIKTIGSTFTTKEIITCIEPLMMDPEKVVHQGMGWLLREIWKIDPVSVEALLMKWRNDAPRIIFQYATEKMDSEYRMKFRRD